MQGQVQGQVCGSGVGPLVCRGQAAALRRHLHAKLLRLRGASACRPWDRGQPGVQEQEGGRARLRARFLLRVVEALGSRAQRLAPVGLEGRGAAPCRRSRGLFGRPLHGSVRLTRMAAQAPGGRTATFSS